MQTVNLCIGGLQELDASERRAVKAAAGGQMQV